MSKRYIFRNLSVTSPIPIGWCGSEFFLSWVKEEPVNVEEILAIIIIWVLYSILFQIIPVMGGIKEWKARLSKEFPDYCIVERKDIHTVVDYFQKGKNNG